MHADALTYFAEHSPVTDPGEMVDRLIDLPDALAGLSGVARGLVIHYMADQPSANAIRDERMTEIDSRYAEVMLARLAELDDRPLTRPRPPGRRLVGCCRDFTVLLLSMARRVGMPARARVGFATYFVPGFNVDHEVAEVWDAGDRRWRLIDAELEPEHRDPADGARIDPNDVPRDRFLVAGAAWRLCRAGQADPDAFLVAPDLDIPTTRGWPYLRHNLIHDLAALNKREMILWDWWGLMLRNDITQQQLATLDRVAEATAAGQLDLAQLRRLYDEPELKVPATVTSYNPLSGEPRTITTQ